MRYFVLIGMIIAMTATWTGAWFYVSKRAQIAVEAFLKKDITAERLNYQKLQIILNSCKVKIVMN